MTGCNMGCDKLKLEHVPCALHCELYILSSVFEIADDAFYGCCRRLSLVFPQEITDFMSTNNIGW